MTPHPLEKVVAVARAERADYGELVRPAPELPGGATRSVAQAAVRDLLLAWGLDAARAGRADWNPLGDLVEPGQRVALKPNWVTHDNRSGRGLECLVTHATFIDAVLDYVALARPRSIVLGDAPVQGCDFAALRRDAGIDALVERHRARGLPLTLVDFRRTLLPSERIGGARLEAQRDLDRFVLYDLGKDSLLEEISADWRRFRVTMYDPRLMWRTHSPGRHQYLVACEVIDADVVFNLPKLKTHKKACVTGALKNLVGINGHKEYLPHHRKGGARSGGDCYPGGSRFKALSEEFLDRANGATAAARQRLWSRLAHLAFIAGRLTGQDRNLEGSWSGNQTVWRTCLDLQRILRYGRPDATLGESPARRVVSITDAIVAGEGEGPMSPLPVPLGLVTGALNPAAAEWIHARLMGFAPQRIPVIREAFGRFRHPLASFGPEGIRVLWDGRTLGPEEVFPPGGRVFLPPQGWRGSCELDRPIEPRASAPAPATTAGAQAD